MNDYLFVYGTLRKNAKRYWHHKLLKNAEFIAEASFQGKLYRVNNYPGAVPSTNLEERVYGEVYRLSEPRTVLTWLDKYECCAKDKNAEYLRQKKDVYLNSGESIKAWIYLYNRPILGLPLIMSGCFIKNPTN